MTSISIDVKKRKKEKKDLINTDFYYNNLDSTIIGLDLYKLSQVSDILKKKKKDV